MVLLSKYLYVSFYKPEANEFPLDNNSYNLSIYGLSSTWPHHF